MELVIPEVHPALTFEVGCQEAARPMLSVSPLWERGSRGTGALGSVEVERGDKKTPEDIWEGGETRLRWLGSVERSFRAVEEGGGSSRRQEGLTGSSFRDGA